ncbi:MAG: tRNA(Glu)-specific nuclease WapA precursor [Microgenomates bacterium OLB22]|nr:MAG: tRNA(Glu)-specific nuclease WapA precursor [Microgenomates bacterium OLB22]
MYGNTTKSVTYADVDPKNGVDLRTDDTRYSYAYFLQNPGKWMLALPYLSYSSDKGSCDEEDKTCQFGRVEQLFDNKGYKEIPEKAWVTESHAYRTKDSIATIKQEYDEHGNVSKTYGPKPNQKTSKDLVQLSETIYDPYFHTLVTQQQNALGHKTLLEDYDERLQLPRVIKKQIQKDSDTYMVSRFEYDSIGRMVKEFSPDPEQPGKSLLVPSQVNHYFISDSAGLRVRSMNISSQENTGGIFYMTTDSFYDGTGKPVQVQVLSSTVKDKATRLVSHTISNAAGQQDYSYDLQEEQAIEIGPDTITNPEPVRASLTAGIVGVTTRDAQGRVTSVAQIDKITGKRVTTSTSSYLLNAIKTTNLKGVVVASNTDGLGRPLTSVTYSADSSGEPLEGAISNSIYAKSMIDKPTTMVVTSLRPVDGGKAVESTFTYDDAGQIVKSLDPSFGPYSAEYDVLGNKVLDETQPGEKTSYTYDVLGRLRTRTFEGVDSKGTALAKSIKRTSESYTYDEGANALGMLSRVEYSIGTESYTYDGGQRIKETRKTIFDVDRTFTSEYNKFSQLRSQKMPDSSTISYTYDRQGRPKTISLNGNELLKGKLFDKYGKEVGADIRGSSETFTSTTLYDGLERVKELFVSNKASLGTNVYKETLSYNDAMEIERIDEISSPQTHRFDYTYNAFSQLMSATSDLYSTSYDYDIFGRIRKKDEGRDLTYEYDNTFPQWAPKTVSVAGIATIPTPAIPKVIKTPVPPTPGPSVEVGEPTEVPTTSPTTPQSCSFDATAFVKECLNADCTQTAPLAAFDGDSRFGLANEAQRGDGSDAAKDKPVQTFNMDKKSDQVGLNIQHFDDFRSALKDGNFSESVKLYYDTDNWTIVT